METCNRKYWFIKCRKKLPGRKGWSWDGYFHRSHPDFAKDHNWGGPSWIRSAQSRKYIADDVKKNDLVVCYQYEGRRICGLTRMVGDGDVAPKKPKKYCIIHLEATKNALQLDPPLTIPQLRETSCDPEWTRKGQGTIFPIDPKDFEGILAAIRQLFPISEEALNAWLKKVGYNRFGSR